MLGVSCARPHVPQCRFEVGVAALNLIEAHSHLLSSFFKLGRSNFRDRRDVRENHGAAPNSSTAQYGRVGNLREE